MMRLPIFAALLSAAAVSAAAAPVVLVPNRATYEVSLQHRSAGGLVAAHGRVVIEFRDVCDGWSTTQRMVADVTSEQGTVSRTDFLINAWESKDGREMRFDIANSTDGKLDERRRGRAGIALDGAGVVTLAEPKADEFPLPRGTLFPTGQTAAIVQLAQAGTNSFKGFVFQGGGKSDLYVSTAEIGAKATAAATDAERATDKSGLLKGAAAWPVLVSFFPNDAQSETPDYEVVSRLYANGINGSMSLVYSNYTLRATLTRIEPLPPDC